LQTGVPPSPTWSWNDAELEKRSPETFS
jgi:hypothetical protein